MAYQLSAADLAEARQREAMGESFSGMSTPYTPLPYNVSNNGTITANMLGAKDPYGTLDNITNPFAGINPEVIPTKQLPGSGINAPYVTGVDFYKNDWNKSNWKGFTPESNWLFDGGWLAPLAMAAIGNLSGGFGLSELFNGGTAAPTTQAAQGTNMDFGNLFDGIDFGTLDQPLSMTENLGAGADFPGFDMSGIDFGSIGSPGNFSPIENLGLDSPVGWSTGGFKDIVQQLGGKLGGSTLSSLFGGQGGNNLTQPRQGTGTGGISDLFTLNNLFGLGGGIYDYLFGGDANEERNKRVMGLVDRADPFGPERGFYQGKLRESYTNPNSYLQSPEFQAINDMFLRGIEAKDAAAGRRSQYGERAVQAGQNALSELGKYRQGLQAPAGTGIDPGRVLTAATLMQGEDERKQQSLNNLFGAASRMMQPSSANILDYALGRTSSLGGIGDINLANLIKEVFS